MCIGYKLAFHLYRDASFLTYLHWFFSSTFLLVSQVRSLIAAAAACIWCITTLRRPEEKQWLKSLMSIMDQIDPPWQTANIFVLFNAFETLCFFQCITDISRVYFSSVNVRKSCKYIHFAVRSGQVNERCCMHAH